MGINVKVHKELTEYKQKILIGLTARQLICVGLALLLALPVYILALKTMNEDLASYVLIFMTLPILAFAVVKKNDLPLEKYLKVMIRHKFLLPKIRTYQTNSLYEVLAMEEEKYEQLQEVAKKEAEPRQKTFAPTKQKNKKRNT